VTSNLRMTVAVPALVALLVTSAMPAAAQNATPAAGQPATSTAPRDDDPAPVSLDRIRRELQRAAETKVPLSDPQLRFYVEVFGKAPRFDQVFEGFDLRHGPVPRAGVTHQEFLQQVTPPEYRPYAGLTAAEAAQAALTTYISQWLIEQAKKAAERARTEGGRDEGR
jgi:hypothetical protein